VPTSELQFRNFRARTPQPLMKRGFDFAKFTVHHVKHGTDQPMNTWLFKAVFRQGNPAFRQADWALDFAPR
jgi:hypothetical protein